MLRQMFSGVYNQTVDIARVLWFVGVLSYIAFAGYHVYHDHQLDPLAYGTGLGAVLAGGGAGVGLKVKGEPSV